MKMLAVIIQCRHLIQVLIKRLLNENVLYVCVYFFLVYIYSILFGTKNVV